MKYPIKKTLEDITDTKQFYLIQTAIDKICAESILLDFPTEEKVFGDSSVDSFQTIKIIKNSFRSDVSLDLCAHTVHVLTIKYKSFGHPQEWKYYIVPNSLCIEDVDSTTEICLDCLLGFVKS